MKSSRKNKRHEKSGAYGRAAASLFLGLFNYGWNVANRNPLPEGLAEYSFKETGRSVPDPSQEELYLRMSDAHVSRNILKALLKIFNVNDKSKKNIGAVKKALAAMHKEIKTSPASGDLDKLQRLLISLDSKIKGEIVDCLLKATNRIKGRISGIEYKLGRLLTPEQCLEEIFAKLTVVQVHLVYSLFKKDSFISSIQDYFKYNKLPEESSTEKVEEEFELCEISYSYNIRARMDFIHTFNKLYRLQDEDKGPHVKPVISDDNYPCIVISLADYDRELSRVKELTKIQKDHSVNLIASVFCSLLNYHSIRKFGKEFAWAETQNGFGSIRPSVTDTGSSIRLSPGLLPREYVNVVLESVHGLNTMIPKILEHIINNSGIYISQNIDHTPLTKKRRRLMHLKVFDLLLESGGPDHVTREHIDKLFKELLTPIAQRAAPKKQATKKGKKKVKKSRRNNKSKEVADTAHSSERMNKVKSLVAKSEGLTCNAPEYLIRLIKQLVLQHMEFTALKDVDECFAKDMKAVIEESDKLIAAAMHLISKDQVDYSRACSLIEHLTRLLKIKNDLDLLCNYTLQNIKIGGIKRPGRSRALSMDEAFPAIGGMSSLADIIYYLPHTITGSSTGFKGQVYFEFDNLELKRVCTEVNPSVLPGAAERPSNDEDAVKIMVVDLNPFSEITEKLEETNYNTVLKAIAESKPQILILDITVTEPEILNKFILELQKLSPGQPSHIITFASDHKLSQIVDLVPMGEIRVIPIFGEIDNENIKHACKLMDGFMKNLYKNEAEFINDTMSARSARRTFESLGVRRSRHHRLTQSTSSIFAKNKIQDKKDSDPQLKESRPKKDDHGTKM
jgi:hypothetical protein